MEIEVDGIKIEIIRKRIKHLHLHVNYGGIVYITAPNNMPLESIMNFVFLKRDWLNKQVSRLKKITFKGYYNGNKAFLLDGEYFIVRTTGKKRSVKIKDDKILITTISDNEDIEPLLKKFLKNTLIEILKEKIKKYSDITDLYPSSYYVRDMKTRWGTCNVKTRRICFNLRLITKRDIFIDYVVIHEIGHIKYPNHGDEFKKYMDKYCPQWRKIKKELNKS